MRLTDRQAIVVTGAAGGIGSAIVSHILAHHAEHGNADVFACDMAWAESTQDSDERVRRHSIDVTDAGAVGALFTLIAATHRLRAVVNAAGVLAAGPAVEATASEVDRMIEVNLRGVIHTSLTGAQTMLRQSPASAAGSPDRSILTISSNAGGVPRAGFAAYGASKAAASHFTRSLGLELGAAGIRCNVVSPGTTRTAMVDALWDGEDCTEQTIAGDPARFRTGIPLGRIATPDDIAAVATFLLTDAARQVTLGDVTIDGGATAR